jgi:hypothetical protein
MTVPGEQGYWINDCWDESPEELIRSRIGQMEERLYEALPNQIALLEEPDQEEASLALWIAARHCMREALRGHANQKALKVLGPRVFLSGFMADQPIEEVIQRVALLQGQRDARKHQIQALEEAGMRQGELMEAAQ